MTSKRSSVFPSSLQGSFGKTVEFPGTGELDMWASLCGHQRESRRQNHKYTATPLKTTRHTPHHTHTPPTPPHTPPPPPTPTHTHREVVPSFCPCRISLHS